MTLMLSSIRPRDILLTADGRSTTRVNGVVTGVDDRSQKLFPVPDHPLVIAHMGENRLGELSLGEFLGRFMRQLNAGDLTVLQVADRLRDYAHPAIRTRLTSLGLPANGCNLWVAGFGFEEKEPSAVELFWQLKDGALTIVEQQFRPISITSGGDGKSQIRPADLREVADRPIEQVRTYHRSLMNEALNAKVEHNSVGGHVHEVHITREHWRWMIPPKPPSPASTRPAPAG